MRKTVFFLLVFLMVFTVSACDSDKTLEHLAATHQDVVTNGYETYLDYKTYFNVLSGVVLKSSVLIMNYVGHSQEISTGSGVVFMEDAFYYYALTNNHVIYVREGTTNFIRVHDYQGNIHAATVIASDKSYDLAVIRFPKTTTTLQLIVFAGENATVADHIAIIGYPARQINAITLGVVFEYAPIELSQSDTDIVDIQFDVVTMDAPVKGGSSGSLVVNLDFELIGILFAGTREGAEFTKSYAVPIEQVIVFLTIHGLITDGEPDA